MSSLVQPQVAHNEVQRHRASRPVRCRPRTTRYGSEDFPSYAVVAQLDVDPALLRECFPGWIVLRPGDPLVDRQFDRVVVLMVGGTALCEGSYEAEADWLLKLRNMLPPGGALEMIACSERALNEAAVCRDGPSPLRCL